MLREAWLQVSPPPQAHLPSLTLSPSTQPTVTSLGWELLALFAPHLTSPSLGGCESTWSLVDLICKVWWPEGSTDSPLMCGFVPQLCSAKEMSLALLEVMQETADYPVLLRLAQPLGKGRGGFSQQVSSVWVVVTSSTPVPSSVGGGHCLHPCPLLSLAAVEQHLCSCQQPQQGRESARGWLP